MEYIQLNEDWNAHPNAPETSIFENEDNLQLEFYLNNFIFEEFDEDDKGLLVFKNCSKYNFSNCNDESYFREQYRFTHKKLPYGEFYQLKGDYDFDGKVLSMKKSNKLKHYIFMLKENILECYAESFSFSVLKKKF
ncbi:hypothetical protein [Polaribacter aestuariivivens]|uniref:hypothetical protein n=1 Tax=Polaribacter aestuariivivens TaxID=2304626 RepID=UPI003F496380